MVAKSAAERQASFRAKAKGKIKALNVMLPVGDFELLQSNAKGLGLTQAAYIVNLLHSNETHHQSSQAENIGAIDTITPPPPPPVKRYLSTELRGENSTAQDAINTHLHHSIIRNATSMAAMIEAYKQETGILLGLLDAETEGLHQWLTGLKQSDHKRFIKLYRVKAESFIPEKGKETISPQIVIEAYLPGSIKSNSNNRAAITAGFRKAAGVTGKRISKTHSKALRAYLTRLSVNDIEALIIEYKTAMKAKGEA